MLIFFGELINVDVEFDCFVKFLQISVKIQVPTLISVSTQTEQISFKIKKRISVPITVGEIRTKPIFRLEGSLLNMISFKQIMECFGEVQEKRDEDKLGIVNFHLHGDVR
ncbi:hypothetical protein FEM48_Zijuj02G0139300 [Ziziphus jujuba var. spinosa]|uniref:Uncharacterized protein n=1 Tax=Ziziphus jujuba var. spinosa TaxID=714518 RepID=A0A978VW34_ZIZJJ|nr:hypothetical protein FEM48_Zijuj02G0139300 [Ziziphus jujuba var. spinosa]